MIFLDFAKKWNARWNEPREPLQRISSKNLLSTKATIEAIQVKSSTLEIEVQETCNAEESRILNKEIEHETTYMYVYSTDNIINSYLLVVRDVHPILSRLLPMGKFQNFHVTSCILILVSCFNFLILAHYKT